MDEVFGVADFSKVEDVGIAASRAKRIDDENVEDVQPNKSWARHIVYFKIVDSIKWTQA